MERHLISLIPMDWELHVDALQGLYAVTPGYWALYDLSGCPPGQAALDLQAVKETPGRMMLGIVRRVDAADPEAGAELIGAVDFRLYWPDETTAYIGMLMVAGPCQRQGIGSQAWALLKPWLASTVKLERVRLGVEQFNHPALKFWLAQGFALTGESNRIQAGDKLVRQMVLELALGEGARG